MRSLVLILLSGLAFASQASAGHPYYYPSTTYCAPTYSGHSYNYSTVSYSAWAYWVYPGTPYYYRVRYRFDCGQRYLENDGWLYSSQNGCYYQHCKIADYQKPTVVLEPSSALHQLGQLDVGYDAQRYAIAKAYGPQVASLLQQQGVPSPVDVAALIPPPNTLSSAIVSSATKTASSGSDLLAQVLSAEQATQRANNEIRGKLAMQVAALQSTERIIGQVKEIQAVASQQATISATANADQIPISEPTLKQIVSTSCFQCHGGAKTEGGLDFKQAAAFGAKEWKAIRNAVISGRMPKGGQPLDDNQQQFFEDQYDRARSVAVKAPAGF